MCGMQTRLKMGFSKDQIGRRRLFPSFKCGIRIHSDICNSKCSNEENGFCSVTRYLKATSVGFWYICAFIYCVRCTHEFYHIKFFSSLLLLFLFHYNYVLILIFCCFFFSLKNPHRMLRFCISNVC